MQTSDFISALALLVSAISLLVSLFVAMRDRARIQATSRAFKNGQTGEYSYILVRVLNKGRRPITLLYLTGVYGDNLKIHQYLGQKGTMLREGEHLEEKIGKFDGLMVHDEDGYIYDLEDLMFTDVEGKEYKVAKARSAIKLVRDSKHEFGIRTHYES